MSEPASKRTNLILAIFILLFATYNIVLFIISGFKDHGANFWMSYAFINVAFIIAGISGYLLKNRSPQPKDWILGFPIFTHCAICIAVEFCVSTFFMVTDRYRFHYAIGLVIQIIIIVTNIIFVISCFLSKEIIEDVQVKTNGATDNIRILQDRSEILAAKSKDKATSEAFKNLADKIRFSDPVSKPSIESYETDIRNLLDAADSFISASDYSKALECCKKAEEKLVERNTLIRDLKKS